MAASPLDKPGAFYSVSVIAELPAAIRDKYFLKGYFKSVSGILGQKPSGQPSAVGRKASAPPSDFRK